MPAKKANRKSTLLISKPEQLPAAAAQAALREFTHIELTTPAHYVALGRMLAHRDAKIVAKAATLLDQGGLLSIPAVPHIKRALLDPKLNPKIKCTLVQGCQKLGRKATTAGPALVLTLKDKKALPTLRMYCANALAVMGGRFVDQLLDYFDEAPQTIGHALGVYGAEVERIAPALVAKIKGKSPSAKAAIEAVGWLGAGGAAAIPGLCAMLREARSAKEAYPLVMALTEICGRLKSDLVRQTLLDVITQDAVMLEAGFYDAFWWAGALASQAPAILPDLKRLARHSNPKVRKIVADAMEEIEDDFEVEEDVAGEDDGDTKDLRLQIVNLALEDDDPEVRAKGLEAIQAALADRGGAVLRRKIAQILKSGTDEERREAAAALGRVEPGLAATVVPLLIEALDDEHFTVQYYSLESLEKLGTAAAAALPRVREFLHAQPNHTAEDDPWETARKLHFDLRSAASQALAAIDTEGISRGDIAQQAARLPRTLEEFKRWSVQLDALQLMQADAEKIGALLEQAAASTNKDIRKEAMEQAGRLKGSPEVALKILGGGLKDRDEWVVRQACSALTGFGASAAPLLPRLRQLMGHSKQELRLSALTALLQCGAPDENWPRVALNMVLAHDYIWTRQLLDKSPASFASVAPELHAIALDADYDVNLRALCAMTWAHSMPIDERRDAPIWDVLRFALDFRPGDGPGNMREAQDMDLLPVVFKGLARFPKKSRALIPKLREYLQHRAKWVQAAAAECLLTLKATASATRPSAGARKPRKK